MSAAECLDFDFAFLDFDQWFKAQQNATVWGAPDETPKGKVQKPKYATLGAILDTYHTGALGDEPPQDARAQERQDVDALLTEIMADAPPLF